MYVIMIDLPEKLKEFLTLKFLSLGIQIYVGETKDAVQKLIDKEGLAYLFVSINQLNSPWLQFLAHLLQYREKNDYKLIILSSKSDREFVQTLLLLNVEGLIPGNYEKEDIYKRLYKLIKSKDIQHDKREYQRVAPRDTDDITVNLSIPNTSTIVTGKVINLSIGGLAVQLDKVGYVRWLTVGQVVDSAQIRLNGKIGLTGLQIVGIKNNTVGLRLSHPTDFFLNLLGRYLLERLSG